MRRRIFLWMGLSVLFISFLGLGSEALADTTYKVKRGDTLAKVSKKFGVGIQALKSANALSGNALKPNQVLNIPGEGKKTAAVKRGPRSSEGRYYTVKRGDTLAGIARENKVSIADLRKANHLRGTALKPGQRLALAGKRTRAAAEVPDLRRTEASLEDEIEDDDEILASEDDLATVEQEKDATAAVLSQWNNPDEPRLFVRVVKGFLGTPYRFGGSSVRGIDCSAFVAKIYQVFDVNLPRTAREQSQVGKRVTRDELEVGDLVFFNTRRAFGHVGIYIGNNEFIHAAASRRERAVRIDSLDTPYYNKRFIKAVRLKSEDKV